jgi:multidrug efflux pump subunit AcrB
MVLPQIEELNDLAVRSRNGTVTYIRDVAHVRDGFSPQTNMVRVDGRRAVLMNVRKTGKASTIDITNSIKEKLARFRASLRSLTRDDTERSPHRC